jgi:hypothetical protein
MPIRSPHLRAANRAPRPCIRSGTSSLNHHMASAGGRLGPELAGW